MIEILKHFRIWFTFLHKNGLTHDSLGSSEFEAWVEKIVWNCLDKLEEKNANMYLREIEIETVCENF